MFNGEAFPVRVDKTDVRHVETLTSALRALDYEYGGGACRDACVALLNWANPLLDAGSSGRVLQRLQVAIADLHNLAGWASFDMGLLESAHLHFGRAMDLARASGNSALEANIHYRMGRVHLHYELAEDALASFQRGLPIAQASGSTLAVSILHANEAWAFAKMGAEKQALRQFARAEEEFQRAEGEDAPPWARFFDLADLVSIGGMVHTELARTCDVKYARSAIPLLTRAIASGGEEASRSQSFRLAALAVNYLVQNEAEHAREIGEQAIAVSGPIRSARTRGPDAAVEAGGGAVAGQRGRGRAVVAPRRVHVTGSGLSALEDTAGTRGEVWASSPGGVMCPNDA